TIDVTIELLVDSQFVDCKHGISSLTKRAPQNMRICLDLKSDDPRNLFSYSARPFAFGSQNWKRTSTVGSRCSPELRFVPLLALNLDAWRRSESAGT
ncbi:MAG TPA: hypothetical protein VL334_25600, partial [Anaerolineae bacterium]|nr:hypothetical protein [Anaerolineae bacterium]